MSLPIMFHGDVGGTRDVYGPPLLVLSRGGRYVGALVDGLGMMVGARRGESPSEGR